MQVDLDARDQKQKHHRDGGQPLECGQRVFPEREDELLEFRCERPEDRGSQDNPGHDLANHHGLPPPSGYLTQKPRQSQQNAEIEEHDGYVLGSEHEGTRVFE